MAPKRIFNKIAHTADLSPQKTIEKLHRKVVMEHRVQGLLLESMSNRINELEMAVERMLRSPRHADAPPPPRHADAPPLG